MIKAPYDFEQFLFRPQDAGLLSRQEIAVDLLSETGNVTDGEDTE